MGENRYQTSANISKAFDSKEIKSVINGKAIIH